MPQSDRSHRFADWTPLQDLSVSGKVEGLRPFFAGDHAHRRMDAVRRAINEIRVNWHRYPQFMQELRELMAASPSAEAAEDGRAVERLEALFGSTKEWHDGTPASRFADYSAIQLYTSEHGYRKIFSSMNAAFRNDDLENDDAALRSFTFMVELLNIDLFNYRAGHPGADNFEGHVYRGMSVSETDLERLSRTAEGPISERYLSIPLAMTSASRDRKTALAFALAECSRQPDRRPLLWDITVSGLAPELLNVYQERFPDSVVTSLCAVPIDEISDYRHEREVILRGPHFQIVRLAQTQDASVAATPLHVVEAIMLNSNRDHVSAVASNLGADRSARELFRAMVMIQRSAICADRAERYGLERDADSYRQLVRQNRATVKELASTIDSRR